MLLEYILNNLIYYFLPLAVSSTIVLLASEKIRSRKKIILWGNLLFLFFIVIFSVLTCPEQTPLQVEWAFYALKEKSLGEYEMYNLLGKGTPLFLGVEDKLGVIKGIPTVHSGEHCQMRIKLNRKGYIYIFHFDSTFSELRQLFPSKDILQSNPVLSNSWVEFPSGTNTWKFDQNPSFEVFLAYASLRESNAIKEKIAQIINESRKSFTNKAEVLKSLLQQLMDFGPNNFTSAGEFEHNLTGVKPTKVKTYAYQAQNGQSTLLLQFLLHEP